jgi:hypothetical protein
MVHIWYGQTWKPKEKHGDQVENIGSWKGLIFKVKKR